MRLQTYNNNNSNIRIISFSRIIEWCWRFVLSDEFIITSLWWRQWYLCIICNVHTVHMCIIFVCVCVWVNAIFTVPTKCSIGITTTQILISFTNLIISIRLSNPRLHIRLYIFSHTCIYKYLSAIAWILGLRVEDSDQYNL